MTEQLSPLELTLKAAERELANMDARERLMPFMKLVMPDTEDPDDATRTEYQETPHGRMLCELVEKFEKKGGMRTAVSVPPQHGKTIHISQYGLAWLVGRNPRAKIVVATYNEIRAGELGEKFRAVVNSPAFRQIFPDFALRTGSQSKTSMTTTKDGTIFFVGAGGTITGRTADYFVIDDPIKDKEQANSATEREKLWTWFFAVAFSRGSKRTPILVVHTRWHADDLIGRLCDADHPERRKRFDGIADNWDYINISGVITDEKLASALGLKLEVPTDPKVVRAFGTRPMTALWAEDKDLAHFAQWKFGEPDSFSALVMGRPSAEDGDFFKAEWLRTYAAHETPSMDAMTVYGASDHAVSTKQARDYTIIGCVGVDHNHNIYVLPDLVWDRIQTDKTVEAIIGAMQRNKPVYWWMESELISKSFGPFLRKRMDETRVYVPIDPVTPSKDKSTRARSIQGYMSSGKVFLPSFAPWFADAKAQLLKFPAGANDDFVDWIAHIGMGLMKQYTPERPAEVAPEGPRVGSIHWILNRTKEQDRSEKQRRAAAGW